MTFSANRNPYEAALGMVWDVFEAHLDGKPGGLFCVVSNTPLGDTARNALESSAAALGFGTGSCSYVSLQVGQSQLGANDLRMVVEGLDPSVIIACDAQTASALSHAYQCEVPTNASCRVLGRTCVAFRQIESMFDTSADKQKVWALLKRLKS